MNNVQLIGRLTRDPELRYSTGSNQTAICRFSIAINSVFGSNERVDYPNIVVFGRMAENCEKFLHKGSQCAVSGRLQTGSYEKDGRKVYTTDVVANAVEFLGGNKSKGEESNAPQTQSNEDGMPSGFTSMNDDIPF